VKQVLRGRACPGAVQPPGAPRRLHATVRPLVGPMRWRTGGTAPPTIHSSSDSESSSNNESSPVDSSSNEDSASDDDSSSEDAG